MAMTVIALAMIGCAPNRETPAPNSEPLHLTGSCAYRDYGSTCSVACDADPDVPITVTITWGGPYCCAWPPGIGQPQETFTDCRCDDGVVLCLRGGGTTRLLPASTCEFCSGTPSGSYRERDAAMSDTGPDAFVAPVDAGPADGSSEQDAWSEPMTEDGGSGDADDAS